MRTRRSTGSARTVLELIGLTLVAFVIAVLAGVMFIVPMIVLGYDLDATLVLIGGTAAGQIGFLLVAYGYVRFRNVRVPIGVPSFSEWGYIVGGTIVALGAAIGISYLLARLDLLPGSAIDEAAALDPTLLLGLAALSILLVAPAEELLFRGAIQGRLRRQFGSIPAVVVASLLFGAMHLANYTGSILPILAGVGLISVVGAIFGLLYERTNNLAVPIVVHATYNVLLLVTGYLALTYT